MRSLMLFLIGLTFGAAGGFVYAAANGFTLDGHDHADAAQHGGAAGMDHGTGAHAAMHDQPSDLSPADAPQLAIAVTKDPMTGYNLQVSVDGFAFAPQAASMADVPGEGHAHVYVNGDKIARLYGPWMHLDNLPRGDVEIAVTLNANDHRPLAVSGVPIRALTTVTVE